MPPCSETRKPPLHGRPGSAPAATPRQFNASRERVVHDGDRDGDEGERMGAAGRKGRKGSEEGVYATVNDEGTEWRSLVNGRFGSPEA